MDPMQSFSRRTLLGSAAALACTTTLGRAQTPPAAPPPPAAVMAMRTLILVRHGEKNADDPRDPTLSEAGLQRAAALLRLLGETRITHVWTSEYKRTKDFVAEIAKRHELTPEAFPGRDPLGLAERIKAMPAGSIGLVVGHSNTLPVIAKALRAPLTNLAGGTDLRDDEYDRLVVISGIRDGELPALLELRYGA